MRFYPAEAVVLRIMAVLGGLDIALICAKGVNVDIVGYATAIAIGVGMIAGGQYYRCIRDEGRIALAATAAGMFVLFSILGSIFNYMFLPILFVPIDALLFRVDAALGYSWPDVVTWAAEHPWIGTTLHFVYFTSLPQLLIIILMLGFRGEQGLLHRFLLTGVFGALISIMFWVFFPTFGAKAYHTLPTFVLDTIPLAVDPAYGTELMQLGREGVDYLSPKNVLGLIGFPSFHIVMACMSVCFAPRIPVVFGVIAALNALMLPAVLVQGGHHLSDIFGGITIFAVAFALANLTMRSFERDEDSFAASQALTPEQSLAR